MAGQTTAAAPSPLAFVTAILHGDGGFVPTEGIGAIPLALAPTATESGVEFASGATGLGDPLRRGASRWRHDGGRRIRRGRCGRLQQQWSRHLSRARSRSRTRRAPGVGWRASRSSRPASAPTWPCAAGRRRRTCGSTCRAMASSAACWSRRPPLSTGLDHDGWVPARLIAPMAYDEAHGSGPSGQREYLERILAEPWWRRHVGEARVLHRGRRPIGDRLPPLPPEHESGDDSPVDAVPAGWPTAAPSSSDSTFAAAPPTRASG